MQLELGCPVACTDGAAGELADVVIDPIRSRITHLVVEPHHRHGLARLVDISLASDQRRSEAPVLIRCTIEELRQLPQVEERTYLRLGEFPLRDPDWDVGIQDVLALPYYNSTGLGWYQGEVDPDVSISFDRIPRGEVEIRRASAVLSFDVHYLGHVEGFVVDGDDNITHVVLERGHLWGRRDVTIPIGAVSRVHTDAIILNLTKDQVGALRSVRVRRWQESTRGEHEAGVPAA